MFRYTDEEANVLDPILLDIFVESDGPIKLGKLERMLVVRMDRIREYDPKIRISDDRIYEYVHARISENVLEEVVSGMYTI